MQGLTPHIAGGALRTLEAEIRRLARLAGKELEALHGLQPSLLTAAEVAAPYGLSRRWVYQVQLAKAGARPLAAGQHVANVLTMRQQGVAW